MDKRTFTRIDGSGETTEYVSNLGETLAYIDYNSDRTEAEVTVFTPYNAGARRYSKRPVKNAEQILTKHLRKA